MSNNNNNGSSKSNKKTRRKVSNNSSREAKMQREIDKMQRMLKQLSGEPARVLSSKSAREFGNSGLKERRAREKPRRDKGATLSMAPGFSDFLKANSSAFTTSLAPPFATTNPQPSLANRAARAMGSSTISVPVGAQLVMRVGACDTVEMDGLSYHVDSFVAAGAAPYWCGPYQHSDGVIVAKPSLGIFYEVNAVGTVNPPPLNGLVVLDAVQSWPLATSDVSGNSTQRYAPTCWSVSLINETPIGNRGGDFITVLPDASLPLNGWRDVDLPRYGSYREAGSSSVELHIPARPVDLAYRHPIAVLGQAARMTNPAGVLMFRNGTTNTQTIRIYGAAKYVIAGTAASALTSPADHSPHHMGHYENVSSAITAGLAHPVMLKQIGDTVVSAINSGKSVLGAIASKGLAVASKAGMDQLKVAIARAGFE